MAKFILSVIATFSFCMPAAAQTNMQTTPLQPQQEQRHCHVIGLVDGDLRP